MPTIKDVARKSGFSPTTVSFVLNDAPMAKSIAEKTKARIRRAAAELGYRPNQYARSLRSKRSHTIGVIVFDISDPYCAQILMGVEKALYGSEPYLPLLADEQNDQGRFQQFVTMLLDRQIEGLIVLGNSVHPENDLLSTLRQSRVPTVVIGRQLKGSGVSTVTVDNETGAAAALEHLYALGHRRIAFIRGPKEFVDQGQRWAGVKAFAARKRLRLDRSLIVDSELANAGHEAGYQLTRSLLARGKPFTAVHAYDDLTAFGAICALREAGVDVPGQCSVTGFDGIALAAYYNPPLTTLHQNLEHQGGLGTTMLLAALRNGERPKPVHERVAPQLVVRGSTGPAR